MRCNCTLIRFRSVYKIQLMLFHIADFCYDIVILLQLMSEVSKPPNSMVQQQLQLLQERVNIDTAKRQTNTHTQTKMDRWKINEWFVIKGNVVCCCFS